MTPGRVIPLVTVLLALVVGLAYFSLHEVSENNRLRSTLAAAIRLPHPEPVCPTVDTVEKCWALLRDDPRWRTNAHLP